MNILHLGIDVDKRGISCEDRLPDDCRHEAFAQNPAPDRVKRFTLQESLA